MLLFTKIDNGIGELYFATRFENRKQGGQLSKFHLSSLVKEIHKGHLVFYNIFS